VTHNIDEGLSLATHAAVMDRGKLIRSEPRASIDESKFAAEYRELVAADE
jgi:ABC-type proline/glycine betaine transport system ATPase subunit